MSFRGSSATLVTTTGNGVNGVVVKGPGGKGFDLNDMGTKQARVILDYDAVMANELSVKQNDVLIVYRLPGLDADFIMAERGGVRGKVPVSYLELI